MTTDRTPAELLGAYMALFDAAGDAALWLEAEAEHPSPDPRPAMVAQAKLLRRILADPPALAAQLAEEQAKVAALVALVNEATAEFVRIDPHVQLSGWDPALVPSDLSEAAKAHDKWLAEAWAIQLHAALAKETT